MSVLKVIIMDNRYKCAQDINSINNNDSLVIQMETRVKPELELNRKVCTSCGHKVLELTPDIKLLTKYICTDCMT